MKEYEQVVMRMIETAGHSTQSLGMGRVIGQIFAYLYFSDNARTLDDLTEALGISKGSASMSVRQLEQWGAVEKIWVKGDRKDYFVAQDNFGRIIKNAIMDMAGKRIEGASLQLQEVSADMSRKSKDGSSSTESEFVHGQVEKLLSFQKKAQGLWDNVLLKMLLK